MNLSIPKQFRLILRVIDVTLEVSDLISNLQHQLVIFGFLLFYCQASFLLILRLLRSFLYIVLRFIIRLFEQVLLAGSFFIGTDLL
jgi:hypothetical protein